MLLLAMSFSTNALAYDIKEELPSLRTSPDSVMLNPGDVTLAGVVEVPLYDDGDPTTPGSMVEVVAPDGSVHLFELSLGNSYISIGESSLAAFGAGEPSERTLGKAGPTAKLTSIDFAIGDAQFEGVTAKVGAEPGGQSGSGSLGLLAFDDLAVVVLNSQGVLRLAPAAQGSELSAAVDGSALPYSRVGAGYHKDGKLESTTSASSALLVGTLNDNPVGVRFFTANDQRSQVSLDALGEDSEPIWARGELGVYRSTLELDGLGPMTLLTDAASPSTFTNEPYQVLLGADVTSHWDMAFDPTAKTMTIAVVDETKRSDWSETFISNALEALEPGEDAAEDFEVGAAEYTSVSGAYASVGRTDEALEYALKALEADEDEACTSHLAVGDAYLEKRDWTKARDHYVKTLEIYDPWGDLEPEERAEILEEKAEVEAGYKFLGLIPIRQPGEYEGYGDGLLPQSHACDAARGKLVIAETILDNPDEAHRRWTEERDVEASLGKYAALSYISQGRYEEALSAYMWATSVGRSVYFTDSSAALGMALVQDRLGKRDQAMMGYEQALWSSEASDLLTVRAYSSAVASRQGRADAAKHMGELAAANAGNGTWALVWAEALSVAGEDNSEALAASLARFEIQLTTEPANGELRGAYASALLRSGQADEARAQAEKALADDPNAGLAQLVLGDLATLEGDGEAATAHYASAASAVYWHPMLAVFL